MNILISEGSVMNILLISESSLRNILLIAETFLNTPAVDSASLRVTSSKRGHFDYNLAYRVFLF